MGNLRGFRSDEVAAPTKAGGGWSTGISDAGYTTKVHHFYPSGETRSVCAPRFRKSRAPKPKQQLPATTEYHKACEDWVESHPKGGRKRSA